MDHLPNNSIPIAICGAGPVAQTLALLLHKQGIAAQDIVLFDAKTREQAASDARSIALSFGSQQILDSVNASIHANTHLNTAIQEIHISRRAHFGRCLIRAQEYQLPALGYVARYGDILRPLEIAIENAGIHIQRPVQISQIVEHENQVELELDQNEKIACHVLIQAEGGTFDKQAVGTKHHDYQQTALVCHVTSSHPIAHRAFERFTDEGPLALLPQDHGYSLVWCVRPDTAAHLSTLNEDNFLQALQQAFGGRVGQFLSASQRYTFALGLNTQTTSKNRCIYIGNAAQTLHPVAGQGLNLGLRDASVLASCLAQQPLSDSASIRQAFSQFTQLRKQDRLRSIRFTDSMARLFASGQDGSLTQSILGMAIGALDLFTPAKKQLVEHMIFGKRS